MATLLPLSSSSGRLIQQKTPAQPPAAQPAAVVYARRAQMASRCRRERANMVLRSQDPGQESHLQGATPAKPDSPQQQVPEGFVQDIDLEGFEGLSPEEDEQVPGSYADAMNPNSKLGKAVKAACAELEELNNLELEILDQAQDVLKRLGVKGGEIEGMTRPPKSVDTQAGLEDSVADQPPMSADTQAGSQESGASQPPQSQEQKKESP
ncbi:hypothetical protein DUNSADRAFT_11170 [Dunaliella salina]|uniref:Uncharacterized protein n=1 Tax=Dunaliella salina TaxID=3046 RepID=A0ABQ7GDZ2_DUNSA|nr:hypothetical protein DUNSADRAFT_11170 [Dunaliella salina]|eukprot:KAF5832831.1 hypothetical protein DUNSADRAFT_11170 [Dunaliella salina]